MREVLAAQRLAFSVEFIRQALDEQHAEDEFLELGGIHLAAQDVRRLEEKVFKLGEGNLFTGHVVSSHRLAVPRRLARFP
jgi:hypothetical protein